MLSALPFAKILMNQTHAARRIAARIASEFLPRGNLTPMTHEALCYVCMVGIVVLAHRDVTAAHPPHCRSLRKTHWKTNDSSRST